ncbi:MAG: TMEM175 family protein [Cyanobium sp. LacPavin_0920_WC12_MAG_62_9]|nr:TMEM175 family protein [Cyanobium sp. LacPavin_0920_WC12_MAG_62_9]
MSSSFGSFWRHHRLSSKGALPLFDSVFAVAVTLLAFSLPDRLEQGELTNFLSSIVAFEFIGIAILLYWFKLRRLIEFARVLTLGQLVLIFFSLLAVVLLPKMTELVLNYGEGSGSLSNWTLSQTVNINFLASLFFVDGFTLLFALSLRRHRFVLKTFCNEIQISIRAQLTGFLLLCGLASMELFLPWFNNEFVFVVPIVLLIEEILVARQFSRGMGSPKRDLRGTATKIG